MSINWTRDETEAQRITQELGGHWSAHKGEAPCPICQPERRKDQHALSITDGKGKLLLFCHKCHASFVQLLAAVGLAPRDVQPSAAWEPPQDEAKARAVREIWNEGRPLAGTAAETYLRSRGIVAPPGAPLRFHPDCWHGPSGKRLPALLGWVTKEGAPAIHRTWLRHDGRGKAQVERNKMMLGPVKGGAVRLSGGCGALVVGEGIETTLSLAPFLGFPVQLWAALSASGMAGLVLPTEPGELIIAADGDATGRGAANTLAERAWALGWKVRVMGAPEGQDFNDVLMKKECR